MKRVSVVIPYIRPKGFRRCVEAIHNNANYLDYEIVADEDKERIGVAKKLKQLVAQADGDLVMFLGDDCVPLYDFMRIAVEVMKDLPDGWGLVGLNDNFQDGTKHCTHWLADKRLLPLLDGEFFYTGYRHCYADNELTDRCIEMGRYIFSLEAVIEHINPMVLNDRKLMDRDYARVYSRESMLHDQLIYLKRKRERASIGLQSN